MGGGIFITEFGACTDSDACIAEINRITDAADGSGHSWAYWQFKYYDDITTVSGPLESFYDTGGDLQKDKVKALSRTYAPAVAGVPSLMRFSSLTGAYRLIYVASPTSSASVPTELYYNQEWHYPEGYTLSAHNATVTVSGNNTMIATAAPGAEVDIAITRPYSGNASGTYVTGDNTLSWTVVDGGKTGGFSLSTGADITWWKQVRVVNDQGKVICTLQMQDSEHGPKTCDISTVDQNSLLFDYSMELWAAKFIGHHEKVATIPAAFFGPLMRQRVAFTWTKD